MIINQNHYLMKSVQFIQVTPEQLKDVIVDGVKIQLEEFKRDYQLKEPNQYLTRSEVAKMLQVDLSTIHNWTVKNKLQSYGIGGRVYYKLAEVEHSIIKL